MTKIAVLLGLISTSSIAIADTTAVYKAKSKTNSITMTVEIADNNSVRYELSTGGPYGLILDGIDYFVDAGSREPVVDRVDDLVTAQVEAMAALKPALKEHVPTTGTQLVPTGKVTINGRTGQAFAYKFEKSTANSAVIIFNPHPQLSKVGKITTEEMSESEGEKALAQTVVVISHDPNLAQLGKAMAKQFSTSMRMMAGVIGNTPAPFRQMQTLLQSGAPLSFAGMELRSVNHATINPQRFELPAQPETLDQVRERMKPLAAPTTASPPKP